MELAKPILGRKHVFFMDNLFSSPLLFLDLLQKGTYAVGTLGVNRKNLNKDVPYTAVDRPLSQLG